jgi:hypothetical protein
MNISANHLPIQAQVTPQKVAGVGDTQLNVPSSVDISSQPVSESIAPQTPTSVNPTYVKPVSAKPADNSETANEIENPANQVIGQQVSPEDEPSVEKNSNKNTSGTPQQGTNEIYTEAELELISSLKLRDAEVISHERAHAAVGGQHAGSPSYSYKTGPDGIKYAVSGEVSIDTSKVAGDPQATLQKAQQIKAAALAPAEPSGQDRKVAAKADQMATEARSDLLKSTTDGHSNKVTHAHDESHVPEHFTGKQNLVIDNANEIDSAIQKKMNDRSFHINALYQNSANTISPPSFEVQV